MKNETSIAEVRIQSGRKWLVLHVKWERQKRLWELRGDGSASLEMATSQPFSPRTQANITNPPLHAFMSQLQNSQLPLQPASSTHWELKGELRVERGVKLIALICS